ncbi:MAG: transglutaminase-like cysteine peptidase [Paracoccaceae bacterium]|nr:transglutaminase-like cysteine peptidase [Paracoccaceae bacterium]
MRRPTNPMAMTMAGLVAAFLSGNAPAQTPCTTLALPVLRVDPPPSQYVRFCTDHPSECALTGAAVLPFNPALIRLLSSVTAAVNSDIDLVPDPDRGIEEDWDLPHDCQGDCEDFALEKRHRLVQSGLPSASLTMAIVQHETRHFPHAVLLVETDGGTWVLDNLSDTVMCWDAVPYHFDRREQPGGQWLRFAP